TECTCTRAYITQHQKRRSAASPTLAQIRAHGLLANGVQFLLAHQSVKPFICLARRRAHLDPLRAAQRADISFGDDPVSRSCSRHRVLFEAWYVIASLREA